MFGKSYNGKRVLVTGHTGFKGSWLTLWLSELGAEVSGVALDPDGDASHWNLLGLKVDDHRQDIRDISGLQKVFRQVQPEIVFHLAAQPLVRQSYIDPIDTWTTNLNGTINLLEACRNVDSVQAIVVITSDKCYLNHEWCWGYRETDHLGGHDPYSASKAATEIACASYRAAFYGNAGRPLLATARAGNVIGGGDWSVDRLIPDLIRSIQNNQPLEIRSPNATRPWQHVLESLHGYLRLGEKLLQNDATFADAWNFGPDQTGIEPVSNVLNKLADRWPVLKWFTTGEKQPHEAQLLSLDSSKARTLLNWHQVWDFDTTLDKTISWYQRWLNNGEIISREQLKEFIQKAAITGHCE